MIPHYTNRAQECEWCENDITVGHEAWLYDGCYICSDDCLNEILFEGSGAIEIQMTDDKMYRSDF